MDYLAVAIGGAIGACLRFALAEAFVVWLGRGFPYATLAVNVLGSFILGLMYSLIVSGHMAATPWRVFIGVGILGAFTTFSTFSLDTVLLLQQQAWFKAMLNILLNVVLCLTLAWCGLKLGNLKY
jgi:CrcB protein